MRRGNHFGGGFGAAVGGLAFGLGALLGSTALTSPPVVPSAFEVGFQADQVEPTTFDIYVDNVNGNDSNSGILSEANAKATLAGALAIHAPGQSIGVRNVNGTDYHEAPAIPSNITISGWGAEKPVFSGGVDLTGAIVCTGSDEARVGPKYANVYKVTGLAKTLFVDNDPFNAHLVENGTQMPIAMGRGPNPLFREIESFNLDWWDADTVNTTSVFDPDEGQNVDVIVSHQSSALAGYTEAQILQTDIRFHRAPNGADRTPVSAFDSGTNTVTFDRSGYAEAWEPKYETNVYKKRFCLVNLAAAIQKGEWAFWDNGDGTVDIYYWPMDVANVDTAIQYSDIDVVFNARNSENVTFKSLIVQNTAATQLVGADCPIRLDASVGVANIGPFTLSNIKVKNSYSKGDGYGAVFCRGHDNYLIEQCTFEDIRNAYGVFMSGGTHSDVEGRTLGGNFTRNLIRRADKSPIRVFGNANNMVTRNHAIECGLAAHANKGNHYKGGSKTLWAHNYWWACSGYWTFQEADGQDFIGNWITCHFSDGRGLVDQNRDSAPFSNATTNLVNGDFYFLNNMVAPSEAALLAASFNAMSALGNPNETHARFAAKNNITHGIQVDVESTMITGGEGNNVYTGGTKRQASDVETPYTDVFEDVVAGNYNIKPTSPTRSQTGESLVSLEGSDGAITLAARWPGYDFSKDINGDDWDLANPGVGPETVPGNGPVFAPVWTKRPEISGVQTTGNTLSVSDGTCMATNYVAPIHQWCRVADPYAHRDEWTKIPGAIGSTYQLTAADEGFYPGVISTVNGVVTQVVMSAVAQPSFPISMGSLLVEAHDNTQNIPAGTWFESGTFVSDGTPLVVFLPHHMDSSSTTPTWEVTVGSDGRENGTGETITVPSNARAERGGNLVMLGAIINPTPGTVTIQWRSTDQIIDSASVYVYPVTGLTGIGAAGNQVGGTNRTDLSPSVTTTAANSLVVHMVVRQSLPGSPAPDDVASDVGTVILTNGYSGLDDNAGSTLVDFAIQQAVGIGAHTASLTWTDERSSGANSVELLS